MTYKEFFEERIGQHLRNSIIYKHDAHLGTHTYVPYSHSHGTTTEGTLASLMKQYIFLYAYSSEEVLEANTKNRLDDLFKAAKRALRERLPNRTGPSSGLWGELLMHLLFEIEDDTNERLATRTIYRQKSDNSEIKGFDGMQIKFKTEGVELWLGQAKMGGKTYSYTEIKNDLNNKTNILYTSDQLYFIADKETKVSEQAKAFLERINTISWEADEAELSPVDRAKKMEDFFVKEQISLVFPCVLAYGSPSTYSDATQISEQLRIEIEYAVSKFETEFSTLFANVPYKVVMWVIPIRDLELLRSELQKDI